MREHHAVREGASESSRPTSSIRSGWVSLFAALTVLLLAWSTVDTPRLGNRSAWLACDVVIACWAAAGVTTSRSTPRLAAGFASGALVASVALAAARVAQGHDHGRHGAAQSVAAIAAALAMAIAVHTLFSLPHGELGARLRQWAVGFWYLAAVVTGVDLAFGARVFPPLAELLVWLIALATTLPSLGARYAGASAAGRQRIQLLTSGVVAMTLVAIVTLTLHGLVNWPRQLLTPTLSAATLVPLGLIAAGFPIAARADRLLVRMLRLLGLVVVVAGAYLIALRGSGKIPTPGNGRQVFWWSLVGTTMATLVYLACRGRFERVATHLTYGAREAPDEVVRTFGSRLTRAIPMDELLLQLVESLRKTLTLHSAEIYTGNGEILELAVSVPDAGSRTLRVSGDERAVIARAGVSGNAWASVWIPAICAGRDGGPLRVAPISHAGELLGVIAIFRTEGSVAFREEDDRVLTELARQVGLALHNAQLDTALQSSLDELRRQADELRASRARVVASGDAERRRVERNLHDGAQQHLVALAINLRLAKDLVEEDPATATEMLDELGKSVQDTIKELRELAHGIYPPLLVDSGLTEALRAVAARSPRGVQLLSEGIGRYDRDLEAAIYFCCLEALQNAGKHASDAHVTVRLWEESGGLLFEVSDDGPGFDVSLARGGHGYVNMMDRLGAIGGAVRWESEPGHGTTIRGSVPLT